MSFDDVIRILLIGFVYTPALNAQTDRSVMQEGDSALVALVQTELQARYPNLRPGSGLLISGNPLEIAGGSRTEVHSFREGERVSRFVASTWTEWGKYAVEYFLDQAGELQFVFESGIYFDDARPRPEGRNFWGQPSWERRHYFSDGGIAASVTTGDGAPASSSARTHSQRVDVLRHLLMQTEHAR